MKKQFVMDVNHNKELEQVLLNILTEKKYMKSNQSYVHNMLE